MKAQTFVRVSKHSDGSWRFIGRELIEGKVYSTALAYGYPSELSALEAAREFFKPYRVIFDTVLY